MTLFGVGKQSLMRCSRGIRSYAAVCGLCIVSFCAATAMQTPGPLPASRAGAPAKTAQPVVPQTTTVRRASESAPAQTATSSTHSPSDAVAKPATVVLKDGNLTVKANNSDLSQILRDIADASGMTIDGTGKSARVFGVYGPGDPRDVLSALLADSGSNFMMVGDAREGAPRELVLTAQSDHPPPASAGAAPTSAAPADHEESAEEPSEENQLGPGAITHVPPPGSQDPQDRMQQRLQRLEQMHQQQMQQEQQQEQNGPQ